MLYKTEVGAYRYSVYLIAMYFRYVIADWFHWTIRMIGHSCSNFYSNMRNRKNTSARERVYAINAATLKITSASAFSEKDV